MADDEQSSRREFRKEIVAAAGVMISLLAPLTSALGYSPLANIWSGIAVVVGAIIVVAAIWIHDRGADVSGDRVGRWGALYRWGVVLNRPFYLLAIALLLLVCGAWLEANAGNALTLAFYGSLNDIDVRRPSGVADPATITLRRYGQSTCFFTQANFDLRNATSGDIYVGLISASLDMQDNANAPVLIPHNSPDIRGQNAFLSGIAILTGPAEGWAGKLSQSKEQLTFLRPGQTTRVTVRQEEWSQKNCLSDPNGSIMKDYKGNQVRVTAGIAILRPNGSVQRQDISTGDMPANVQRQ